MNTYEITLRIEDKLDLQDDKEIQNILLNTLFFAFSEEDAINKLKDRYKVLEIISITLKD